MVALNNFDLTVNAFQDLVTEVFSGSNETQKTKLREKLKHFTQIDNAFAKRNFEVGQENRAKKPKLDLARRIDLPNELWMEILKYLKTRDIFGNFALVNKRFYSMIPDFSKIKHFQIENLEKNSAKHENLLNVLGHCNQLMGLKIDDGLCKKEKSCHCYDKIELIMKACKTSLKLKSLKISTCFQSFQLGRGWNESLTELHNKFINHLQKPDIKIEDLYLKGFLIRDHVYDTISKMKSLKSIKIRIEFPNRSRAQSQFIENLANTENKLESIELDFYFSDIGTRKVEQSLSILIEKKKDFLKQIKLIGYRFRDQVNFGNGGHAERLSLCQNLQEFSGFLRCNQLQHLTQLHKLIKLNLILTKTIGIQTESSLVSMSLPNLKYLSIQLFDIELVDSKCCPILTNSHFPSLERLYLFSKKTEITLEIKHFQSLIAKSPNLKSIQINVDFHFAITYDEFCNIFKEFGVFIFFGQVIEEDKGMNLEELQRNNARQLAFEEFLLKDSKVFIEYHKMKSHFSNWCKNNNGYGY